MFTWKNLFNITIAAAAGALVTYILMSDSDSSESTDTTDTASVDAV